jgi:lipoprotein-anchoring transpeptidase ErfK/SrfK
MFVPPKSFFTAILLLVFFSACNKQENKKQNETIPEKTTPAKPTVIPAPELTFSLIKADHKNMEQQFSPERLKILLSLNRADRSAVRKIDSLVCPDTFMADINAYSPFPAQLKTIDSVRKFLLFSYRVQAFAAYENGKQVKWGPTSLGKKSSLTQTGLFHTNWKAKRTTSTVNKEWILDWYFNIDNKTGVSLHQFELPGYPASHACARLSEDDAKWIYDWAEQWRLSPNRQAVEIYGTPVLVFGSYDFSKKLRNNILEGNKAVTFSEDNLKNEITPLLPQILQRQADRESALMSPAAEVMP